MVEHGQVGVPHSFTPWRAGQAAPLPDWGVTIFLERFWKPGPQVTEQGSVLDQSPTTQAVSQIFSWQAMDSSTTVEQATPP